MKKMKCSDMGGPCGDEVSANSWEEMKTKGMEHLQAAHPEMVEGMKNQTPEAMAQWDANGKAKFDALPDSQ